MINFFQRHNTDTELKTHLNQVKWLSVMTAWRTRLGWQWWSPQLPGPGPGNNTPVTTSYSPDSQALIGQNYKPRPLIGQYWGILTKTFRMSLTCELCVISSGTDAGIVPINTFIVFIIHWHNSIIFLFNNHLWYLGPCLVIVLQAHWMCDSLNSQTHKIPYCPEW